MRRGENLYRKHCRDIFAALRMCLYKIRCDNIKTHNTTDVTIQYTNEQKSKEHTNQTANSHQTPGIHSSHGFNYPWHLPGGGFLYGYRSRLRRHKIHTCTWTCATCHRIVPYHATCCAVLFLLNSGGPVFFPSLVVI